MDATATVTRRHVVRDDRCHGAGDAGEALADVQAGDGRRSREPHRTLTDIARSRPDGRSR
jgi:hypothetical protein